ncbi:MAG: tetratricopeptide repeat protein [Deltaproteobacteria bacterium]|nr:tetratricopeptide repeat protein [Deltaproteobacteria bacterium]
MALRPAARPVRFLPPTPRCPGRRARAAASRQGGPGAPEDASWRWASAGFLVALVAVAWANGLGGGFVHGDEAEIFGHPSLGRLERWGPVLAYDASRPLVALTWAVDARLWGEDPFGYHVVNVAIHALNAVLALLVGERVFARLGARRPLGSALAAAALWAVHPMTTEAVTHLAGRSEALAATFCLGAVLEWLRWRREGGTFPFVLSFLAFLAAMATREVAVAVPLLLLLCEAALPGGRLGKAWPWMLPHALVIGAVAVLRQVVHGTLTTPIWLRPLHVQVPTQAEVALRSLGLWVLPVGQTLFHDVPPVTDPLGTRSLAALALVGLLVVLAVRVGRRRPWVAFAAGWFGILLLPSSSIVPLPETMAEHRTYLAGWAVCGTAGALLGSLGARWPRVAGLLATIGVVALGGATWARNAVWGSEVALWQEAVRRAPESAAAWQALGDALRREGDPLGAEAAYRATLRIDDDRLDAWNALGATLAEAGRSEEARSAWLQALRRHPTSCATHDHLGWLHVRERSWDQALQAFHATLAWCPGDVEAHYGLASIYWEPRRDPVLAARHYQEVLSLDSAFPEASLVRERLLSLTR